MTENFVLDEQATQNQFCACVCCFFSKKKTKNKNNKNNKQHQRYKTSYNTELIVNVYKLNAHK